MRILEKILATKKEEVELLKKNYSINSFKSFKLFTEPGLKLEGNKKGKNDLSIIAEIKKASPSKGIINNDFNHLEIAHKYFNNNVDAVSILTDKTYFHGNIDYLNEIANIKKAPLLRKDFIIDELQVYESKANGADLILLICEALSKDQIKDLTITANDIGLDVLLELHSENQLDKIDFRVNKIIGINNRNLETFKISMESTKLISEKLPDDIFIISESGFNGKGSVEYIKQTKANCILVGEYFMSSTNIGKSITELKKWCKREG